MTRIKIKESIKVAITPTSHLNKELPSVLSHTKPVEMEIGCLVLHIN